MMDRRARFSTTSSRLRLTLIFMIASLSACGGRDLGTCIITKSGDDLVIENITLEECQERFLEEPGARGVEWRPHS